MKQEPVQLPGLDTPARQADAAMKRIREFINRSAAQHLHHLKIAGRQTNRS